MTPDLPPELLDAALNLLDSRQDWVRCSLVCRAWLPICRVKLFSKVTLTTPLVEYLEKEHSMGILGPYIRHAEIVSPGDPSDWSEQVIKRPFPLLRKFENLDILTINDLSCDNDINDLLRNPWPLYTVRQLHLVNLYCYSFSALRSLIGAFPGLESVNMRNVEWDMEEEPNSDSRDLCPSFHLQDVEVRSETSKTVPRPFFGWLLTGSAKNASPLRALRVDLDPDDRETCLTFQRLLSAKGLSLEQLDISPVTLRPDRLREFTCQSSASLPWCT